MTTRRKIALAGIGKIARDEHIPALSRSDAWELAATISRNAQVDGVEGYDDIEPFLTARPDVDTVSLALPAGPRFEYAVKAIEAGRNVMLEKPPGVTLAECNRLEALARSAGVTLYASWHSRMGPAVAEAARRLEGVRIKSVRIDWREDVRVSHPGQEWVWEPGNLGVFDPGINALSILAVVLGDRVHITEARMDFPRNAETPIAADVTFAHPHGARITGRFDWRHQGDPIWDIWFETDEGPFALRGSGARLEKDGDPIELDGPSEYDAVYAHLARLVERGESDVDLRPMIHVADAFLLARRTRVDAFEW